MKAIRLLALASLMLALRLPGAAAADSPAAEALRVAQFTSDGKLLKPQDLESWVFVGTSLGLGYNVAQFKPTAPGLFQVVQMEPNAFRYFMKNGHFAPGSMMLLSFYGTQSRASEGGTGYVQSALEGQEIHLIDSGRKADGGHVFYGFKLGGNEGTPVPPGNDCVRCHTAHGAFEGAFIQFYPALSGRIPKEALEKGLADHDIR
jgi:Cytochrome P460